MKPQRGDIMSKTSALFLLLGVLWRPAQALCPRGPRDAAALWTDPSYDPSLPPERGSTDPRVPTSVNLTVLPIAIGKIDTAADAVTLRTTTVKVWRDPQVHCSDLRKLAPAHTFPRRAHSVSRLPTIPRQLAFNASCADKILRHPYLSQHYLPSVVGSPVGLIWTPHTIVGNLVPEGEHEGFSSAFEKFDMASDGTVSWEHQADNHIKCTMDFREMPYDVQHCYMRVLSIRSTDDVRFEVPPADVEDVLYKDPDRLAQMSNAEWDCTAISEVRGFSASEASGDRFSYVDLNFTLRRKPGWYTSNVVLPTIVLIVISWSSFFISRAAVPARVALGIICYLTLNNLAGSVAQQMPKIDGPVRLTALLDTSKFFVLYSVLE